MPITTQSSLIPLYRMLVISTLLALIAVFIYFSLPERIIRVLPEFGNESHVFFDGQKGGNTTAEWINQEAFHFKCNAVADAAATAYCGMSINFYPLGKNANYSNFQYIVLKIRYLGENQRLRLKIHNFKSAQADNDSREVLKGLEVSILADELRNQLSIDNYGWGNFTNGNTVDIGIDLVPPIAPGEHDIQLEYIEVHGRLLKAESWYLGVAIAWLLSNLIFISRYLILQAQRIRNDSQRLSKLAHYSADLMQESEHYKQLSTTDSLTGALNRYGFATEMSQRAPIGKAAPTTALMVIDLDHFKRINDSWGHDTGDVVLRETVQTISKMIRTSDRFVRWGGEEFMLYCEGTNTQQALLIAEKIRTAIEAIAIKLDGNPIRITVSIGVGVTTEEEDFDELFKRSDQALYKAKSLGRNCVVLSDIHAEKTE